ncbi:hypothetical protein FRB96_008002 [Tulasnella sp. 330]|nr:hypothetical protein FRB96_008002 [Tulasnella sp. 330]KAG8881291.1 hypothetical protein FRB97_009704 [Tulasnella sp. 331]
MSELAVTVGVVIAPILWVQYQKRREQKRRDVQLARLVREQQQQQSQQQPSSTSSFLPNAATTDYSLQLPPQKQSLTPTLRFILACLCVHELWIVWKVYFDRPTNIFTLLDMPITTLVSKIRRELLSALDADTEELPPHLEFLLSRFQSFDTRAYYVRFGHHVVTMCTWCITYRDYLFYYLVNVALEYLRTAMLVTVMTMKGSGKRKWRRWTLAAVFGALITEGWAVSMMDMVIPRVGTDCEMWSDRFFYVRHFFFFALPAALHFLPYTYLPLSPFRPLGPLTLLLSRVNERLALASVIQSSSQRHPVLLERRTGYWRNQAEEAGWARDDEDIMKEAERLGLGYGVGIGTSDGNQENVVGTLRGQMRSKVAGMRQMFDNLRPIMAPATADPTSNGDEERDATLTQAQNMTPATPP